MKRLFLLALAFFSLSIGMRADNTKQSVAQVTEAMSLTDDLDLHITNAEPFAETGSIDIVNTEHAVVIFDALRPSLAKAYLSHIKINGEDAQDNKNCQLKLYNRGAILLPYGGTSFRPLTVFDQPDFGGESESNAFTEGHSGGFMKNVPNAWNNRIQSFRLKRGYMVTFALKKGGWGYSRCFIAADSDLEVTLPSLMSGRISSYRIFKWYDAGKAQVADTDDVNFLNAVGGTSSYGWHIGGGTDLLPDIERLAHRYKNENGWPSPSNVGSTNGSPHLKNDNEPLNNADEGFYENFDKALEGILGSWDSFMRTGMRMLTPSSWDGSDYAWSRTGLIQQLLDSIDARGWRCDVIDMHCYWEENTFSTLEAWSSRFKRPIWISEWVWGASWSGGSGIFKQASSKDNPTAADLNWNKTVVSRILTSLNNNSAVERYYYWNHEAKCSKLYYDGSLTPTGEYYSTMNTPLAYNGSVNYIPKAPPVKAPSELTATFSVNKMTCTLKWNSNNGDLADKVQLQRRVGSGRWETISEWTGAEIEEKSEMSYDDVIDVAAAYEYRVTETTYNNKTLTSNSAYNVLSTSLGSETMQYGTISAVKEEEVITFFAHPFVIDMKEDPEEQNNAEKEAEPIVIFGSPTYVAIWASEQLMAINKNSGGTAYNLFKMRYHLWDSDKENTKTNKMNTNYLAVKPGRSKFGKLNYEAGRINDGNSLSCQKEYVVTFSEPFESTPAVFATPKVQNPNISAVMWRIYDVTPEGFKIKLLRESTVTNKLGGTCSFVAFEQGRGSDGEGHIFTVGEKEIVFNNYAQTIDLGVEVENPRIMVQLQTNADEAAAQLRYINPTSTMTTTASAFDVRMIVDKSDTEKALSSSNTTTERVAYLIISDGELEEEDAIVEAKNDVPSDYFTTLTGIRVDQPSRRGIYIVGGRKIVVK